MASRSALSTMSINALDAARAVVKEHGNLTVNEQIDTYFAHGTPALQRLEEVVVLQSLLISALSEIVAKQAEANKPRKRGRPRKADKAA